MDLKTENAQMRLRSAEILALQEAKRNEVQAYIRLAGGDPSLWDYPAGTALSTAQTGDGASTNKLNVGGVKAYFRCPILIRIVTTVGATPTCTYAIEGSVTGTSGWTALYYSNSATPGTFVNTTFTVTTATTTIKLIKGGQNFRYVRLSYSLNTNVTNTVDATPLGDA